MQETPEGGFAGRTNKLVDACYSWWVGGCWSLIEAYAERPATAHSIWNRGIGIKSQMLISRGVSQVSPFLLSISRWWTS